MRRKTCIDVWSAPFFSRHYPETPERRHGREVNVCAAVTVPKQQYVRDHNNWSSLWWKWNRDVRVS